MPTGQGGTWSDWLCFTKVYPTPTLRPGIPGKPSAPGFPAAPRRQKRTHHWQGGCHLALQLILALCCMTKRPSLEGCVTNEANQFQKQLLQCDTHSFPTSFHFLSFPNNSNARVLASISQYPHSHILKIPKHQPKHNKFSL